MEERQNENAEVHDAVVQGIGAIETAGNHQLSQFSHSVIQSVELTYFFLFLRLYPLNSLNV